jgi:hypothetical protein
MPRAVSLLTIPVLLSLSSACSTSSSGDGDTSTSTSETDSETGSACEPPADATPSETAMITIRNDRAEQIYVLPYSSFGCNYGQVEIEVDGAPVLWQHGGTYPFSCSSPDLCFYGCSDGGAMGLVINPGATAEIPWNGGVWTSTPMSQACIDAAGCVDGPALDSCDVLELVEGDYLVRVNLTATCQVTDECMACTDGVCEVFWYEPSTSDVSESFEVTAAFPAGAQIVVN